MTAREFIRDSRDGDRFAMRTEEDGLTHEFVVTHAEADGSGISTINASCFDGYFDRSLVDQELPGSVDCIGCMAREREAWWESRKSR